MDDLRRTVKKDETTKRIIFLTILSAWTKSPINLFLRGPSSIGKTYVTVEAAQLFPQRNIWYIGKLSPTALAHSKGSLIDSRDGERFSLHDAPSKEDFKNDKGRINHPKLKAAKILWETKLENSYWAVDLRNKILLFLEAPDEDTFMMLRPILSHDKEEIEHRVTQQSGSGGHRTKTIKLVGWPATIFCTTKLDYLEELATRSLTHTPDMNLDKYAEAVQLLGHKASFPWAYEVKDHQRARLQDQLNEIIAQFRENNRVVIPYAWWLSRLYKVLMPRDMRDYNKLQNLVEASAMLHYDVRPVCTLTVGGVEMPALVANFTDLYNSISVFSAMEEATRAGLSQHVVRIFYDIIVPHWNKEGRQAARSIKQTRQAYRDAIGTSIGRTQFYNYLKSLEEVGWIEMETDPNDRRQKFVLVTKGAVGNSILSSIDEFKANFTIDTLRDWILEMPETIVHDSVHLGTSISNPMEHEVYSVASGRDVETMFDALDQVFTEDYFSGLGVEALASEIQILRVEDIPPKPQERADLSVSKPLERDMKATVSTLHEMIEEQDQELVPRFSLYTRLISEHRWKGPQANSAIELCIRNYDIYEMGQLVGLRK